MGILHLTLVVLSFSRLNGKTAAYAIESPIIEVLVTAEDKEFGRSFSKSRTPGAAEDIFGALYARHRCVILEHSVVHDQSGIEPARVSCYIQFSVVLNDNGILVCTSVY